MCATSRRGGGLAHIWLDGAAFFAAIDLKLFQVPASEGLAEWLERQALTVTAEDPYMQVAELDGWIVDHIWAAIRPAEPDAAWQMLPDVASPTRHRSSASGGGNVVHLGGRTSSRIQYVHWCAGDGFLLRANNGVRPSGCVLPQSLA